MDFTGAHKTSDNKLSKPVANARMRRHGVRFNSCTRVQVAPDNTKWLSVVVKP
jgi:hypothetical protein